ncbi:hypothetical protein BX661DRAFT_168892 [Kickxella alabastrina]|uniref:uncharacterized protein n=1 Tax=Kickxella alabastrina TaxID=61397 RepID=UPI0022201447|nr:uncharacterized protein BX661DRAFT_168892 [Kickxella alabastrina]KAI7833764.1 hypothetical protein BX661DRAFT_168892 [Kickxella alabastrina]
MVSAADIKHLINTNISGVHYINVEDISGGCGSMFNVAIASDVLTRHKMVHTALGDTMKELHALSLKLYTVAQYEKTVNEEAPKVEAKEETANEDKEAAKEE